MDWNMEHKNLSWLISLQSILSFYCTLPQMQTQL